MAFGEYMQNQQMMGEDEGDMDKEAVEGSEGAVVVETLLNMRTVSSLCMEGERIETYSGWLHDKNKINTLPRNTVKGTLKMPVCVTLACFCETPFLNRFLLWFFSSGSGQGLGSFFQMWGYALMFYFGSWLLLNRGYEMRDYLISLFSLMLSLTGLAGTWSRDEVFEIRAWTRVNSQSLFFFYPSAAMAGLTDVEKAKAAAGRIFELIDRESEIDPLSDEGKKQN
jgi:hypothetical protein